MARAIWSGSISFGLLNVPVKLYSAVSKQTIRFRELREGDGSRVKHKRVAESDGKEVPYEKIVKGYEYAPDQYVVLTKDELSDLEPQRSRAIEIQDFVDLDDIDPIYFEQPYYLGPDKGAARAYALLVQAMNESRKVAIARFVLRNKEHLDLLERKAAGKEVVSAPTEEPKPTKAPDLMAALEESLAAVRSEEVATDGKASKAKPKASRSKSSS